MTNGEQKQPFINKPCISEGICHEDKMNVLNKIRAEIEQIADEERKYDEKWAIGLRYAVKIIDKYKAESEDCRNCKKWDECPCGKEGHTNGTSIGYSIGECKEYEPSEETRELLTADERALFLNKLTHWLNDNFHDLVIGGWQDTDGEIFDLFFIRRR